MSFLLSRKSGITNRNWAETNQYNRNKPERPLILLWLYSYDIYSIRRRASWCAAGSSCTVRTCGLIWLARAFASNLLWPPLRPNPTRPTTRPAPLGGSARRTRTRAARIANELRAMEAQRQREGIGTGLRRMPPTGPPFRWPSRQPQRRRRRATWRSSWTTRECVATRFACSSILSPNSFSAPSSTHSIRPTQICVLYSIKCLVYVRIYYKYGEYKLKLFVVLLFTEQYIVFYDQWWTDPTRLRYLWYEFSAIGFTPLHPNILSDFTVCVCSPSFLVTPTRSFLFSATFSRYHL